MILALTALTALTLASSVSSQGASGRCKPVRDNRPVCPAGAPSTRSAFIDPSVTITDPRRVRLGRQVYIAPFARLAAGRASGARIAVGDRSAILDNVDVLSAVKRGGQEEDRLGALGLDADDGVRLGERVFANLGARIVGPARIGVGSPGPPEADSGVFIGPGSEVDGAIIERDSGVTGLARVGPGVRLRSGFVVLPGKNVTTQEQADDPALGKVRRLTAPDRQLSEAFVEAQTSFAQAYVRLFRDRRSHVRGINFDPGNTALNPDRDLPETRSAPLPPGPSSGACRGSRTRVPRFRNRIVGEVCLVDSLRNLEARMGSQISIRSDAGEPLIVGRIARMGTGVTVGGFQGFTLQIGDRVTYGRHAVVQASGRLRALSEGQSKPGLATVIEDRVRLGRRSLTVDSRIGEGSVIGDRSLILASQLPPGTALPDRTIVIQNRMAGRVEW